jgi:TatD DNase family protein
MGLELQGVLERARQNGVAAIINVALDVESTFAVLAAHSRAPWLHPTAGWHPSSAAKLKESDLEKLDELSKRPEIAAFGEIGLDYFRRPEEAGAQKKALEGLLRVAASCGKPVIIHCRDAFDDLAAILGKERSRLKGVLLHCFSGSAEQARIACDLGCHLSFAGPITFPKAGELRRALAAAPRDALMIETDAPYLAPVPFRGKRNEPSYLVHHLEAMAAVLEISVSEAAALTSKNARLFFGLDERAFSA